jgi:hypothetical protein
MLFRIRTPFSISNLWVGLFILVFSAVWLAACSTSPASVAPAVPSATLSPAAVQPNPPTPVPQPTQAPPASATPEPTALPEPSTTLAPSVTPLVSITAQPGEEITVCLGPNPTPRSLPARENPLEVWFNNAGNIWLWTEKDGSARQLTKVDDARRFTPSPDGTLVVFERGLDQDRVELWAVNRDGSNLRQLVSAEKFASFGSDPEAAANAPTFDHWNPGEHNLVFSVFPVIHKLGACCTNFGYWLVNADTGQLVRALAPATPPYGADGLLSPDGKQAAIVADTHLDLADADGKNLRPNLLTYPHIPITEGPGFLKPSVVWAPDSQLLRVIVIDRDPFTENPTFSTWQVPANGQPAQKLATFEGFPLSVKLSPDQVYLAYWKQVEPMSNRRELHLAKFDGSKNTIYSVSSLVEIFGWTPDGVHIAYTDAENGAQLGSLCGPAIPLTDDASARQVSWVDDRRFLFVGGTQERPELRLGQTGGPSILIGPFWGNDASYQFNLERGAVGQ